MARLHDLPTELLDKVASELRNAPTTYRAYRSLTSLSLTSRKLRKSAQDVLYRTIVLGNPRYEEFDRNPYNNEGTGWSRLGCLVRTLLRRPDLACNVQKLGVFITQRTIGHGGECWAELKDQKSCTNCDWDDISDLCAKFLEIGCSSSRPGFNDSQWISSIRDGEQLAVLGILLACTPKLESLAIHRWSRCIEFARGHYELVPKYFDFQELFGNLNSANKFSMSWIPGFTNLRSISTNCLVSADFVALPKIENLEFGLQDRQFQFVPDAIQLPPQSGANHIGSTLRKMGIILDTQSLSNQPYSHSAQIYAYAPRLVQRLPELKELDLVVRSVRQGLMWIFDASFNSLMEKFPIRKIEILKIDTSVLSYAEDPSYNDDYNGQSVGTSMRWAPQLKPIRDLTSFTELRKIVAAQEAFFSVDEDFTVCELPASIEELGIVDATCTADRWIKHILHSRWKYPNLKSITLWARDRHASQYRGDWRLGTEIDYLWKDNNSNDEDVEVQQPTESQDEGSQIAVVSLTEGNNDNYAAYGSEVSGPWPLLGWQREFVDASKGFDAWHELAAAGIELRKKYWMPSRHDEMKWTHL